MMEYNSARNPLAIRTYGRNIQKMIEETVNIKNPAQRNERAKAIIRIMAQMNPEETSLVSEHKESESYWNKLWDHLIIMSDYKLEVDAPFPPPTPCVDQKKKNLPSYSKGDVRFRTYGRNMVNMLNTIVEYPVELQQLLAPLLANHLKRLHLTYNRDTVEDSFIIAQLAEISNGKVRLPEGTVLEATKELLKLVPMQQQPNQAQQRLMPKKKKKKKKNIKKI